MNIKKPKVEPPYWDEGQRGPTYHHWYRKGFWKRVLRKKWNKDQLKQNDKE